MGKPWEKEKDEKLKGKYKRQSCEGHQKLHLRSPAALNNKGVLHNHWMCFSHSTPFTVLPVLGDLLNSSNYNETITDLSPVST